MALVDGRFINDVKGAACPGHLVVAGLPDPPDWSNFAAWVGFREGIDPATGKAVIDYPRWFAGFYESRAIPAIIQKAGFAACRFALDCVGYVGNTLGKLVGCAGAARDAAVYRKFLTGFLERWAGYKTDIPERVSNQVLNMGCLTEIMSAAQANECYLADAIDYPNWVCHVKAEGYDEKEQAPVVWAGRTRIGAQDCVRLWRLESMPDAEYNLRMRANGFMDDGDQRRFEESQNVLPGLPDIVRMMVRDAADDRVASQYQYDSQFEEKFVGILAKWAKANGVPEETLRYYWRAHWEIPSNTQLYEMLHRLRPGVAGELAVSYEDVAEALRVNDVAPGWVDRLMAISYHAINMSDAVRAFMIRSFTDEQLVGALQDNGYAYENAILMLLYYTKLRRLRDVNLAGGMSTRKIVRLYKSNKISRDEARKRMLDLEIDDEVITLALDGAVLESRDETRGRQVMTVKRKYLKWVLTPVEAASELSRIGLDLDQINRLLFEWEWVRERGERHLSAAQLCQLARSNRIDVPTYIHGLKRLGYDDQAIAGLHSLCQEKAMEDFEKEVKKALADAEKKRKDYERQKAARCRKPVTPCGEEVPEPVPPPPPPKLEDSCRPPLKVMAADDPAAEGCAPAGPDKVCCPAPPEDE